MPAPTTPLQRINIVQSYSAPGVRAPYKIDNAAAMAVRTDGSLSGVVKISGVVAPRVLVRLYDRSTGVLLNSTFTASDGTYSFNGLDPDAAKSYYVTFLDPNESSPFNYTLTSDHLTAG